MKTAPTPPAVADTHWATPPERDPRQYLGPSRRGVLGDGHTRDTPCPGCLRLAEQFVALREQLQVARAQVSPPRRRRASTSVPSPLDGLSTREVILLAACDLGREAGSFATNDLVLRAWRLCPRRLSLRVDGTTDHPDSHFVVAKLSGESGLCARGWLRRVARSTYEVTDEGREVARKLTAKRAQEGAVR